MVLIFIDASAKCVIQSVVGAVLCKLVKGDMRKICQQFGVQFTLIKKLVISSLYQKNKNLAEYG